ncbi:33856_t:CDS:2, partial [Gigaspora margarita]
MRNNLVKDLDESIMKLLKDAKNLTLEFKLNLYNKNIYPDNNLGSEKENVFSDNASLDTLSAKLISDQENEIS